MLFGHQDNNVDQSQLNTPAPVVSDHSVPQYSDPGVGVNPLAVDPATGASLPVVPQGSPGPVDTSVEQVEPSVLNQPSVPSLGSAPAVEDPAYIPDSGTPFSASPAPADANPQEAQEAAAIASDLDRPTAEYQAPALAQQSFAAPPEPQQPSDFVNYGAPATAPTPAAPANDAPNVNTAMPHTNDLLDIKQQAISQLSPLVGHLEQTPEEKFRTTMMLIQATDNSTLLKDAYEAARAIPDDKVRAQALLDVVNEINYFTQQHDAQGN